jgi:hypothetical protein
LPVGLSFACVHVFTSLTPTPTSSLSIFLAWWVAISLGATLVVSVVFALTRRLLPLGALLELSLVFPDGAPSRFRVARESGTVASLEERVRLMREAKEAPTAQEAAELLLRLVAALSDHDRITAGHAERVRSYSYALGEKLGLGRDELDRLNWAALLHDIGKLEVGSEILNKQGPPTTEEWESLRRHPLHGEVLAAPLREWLGEWMDAVGQHHERWDGTGYPRGLSGEEISRAGRIVAIADVYDVITSSRSYKEPSSPSEARVELVRHAGTQFDPRLVRTFVELSLGRLRLVTGPLSWLTHAPLLARIPLTPSVGAALGGVAAVVTTSAAVLAGSPEAPHAAVIGASPAEGTPVVIRTVDPQRATTRSGPPTRTPPMGFPQPRRDPAPKLPDGRPDPREPTPPGPDEPIPAPPAPGDPPSPPADPPDSPPTPPKPEPPGPAPSPPPPPEPPPTPPPPPNQPPQFTAGADQAVVEDAGVQSVGWASGISPGPASEAAQNVAFSVSTDRPGLFAALPSVSADGTLTYAPAADASGSATVSVVARDDGGTANGGADSSAAATFTIVVQAVNDAPSCVIGSSQTALSVLGKQTVSGFASSTPGPADESSQSVSFVVTTDRPGLFLVPPAISSDGTLTYTPRLLGLGVATVTVRAVDDGGTAHGGSDTSPPRTFTITVV